MNDPLAEQYTPGARVKPDRSEDIVLVQVSPDAAACRLAKSAMCAVAADVPICAEPELIM